MFSALSKALSYVLAGAEQEPPEQQRHKEFSLEQTHTQHAKYREFDGTVTHVFNNHGLIDGEVYFSFDDIIGDTRLTAGDKVSLKAVQEHEGGGWHASYLSVVSPLWRADSENVSNPNEETADGGEQPKEIVGMVTYSDGQEGYINDDIFFRCEDSISFVPVKGDWVQADIRQSDMDKHFLEAYNILALRMSEKEGVISAFQGDHGYIDGEVFFSSSVLTEGYKPKKWDTVQYTTIESMQGKCTWRAVHILPNVKRDPTRLPILKGPLQKSFLADLMSDKDGITVQKETDYGQLNCGDKKGLTVWVRNEGIEPKLFEECTLRAGISQLTIESVKMLRDPAATIISDNELGKGAITLLPGMTLSVNVRLHALSVGQVKELLVFKFDNFKIGRFLTAIVADDMQSLVSRDQPYQGGRRQAYTRYRNTATSSDSTWLVPGQRPNRLTKKTVQFPDRLPQYQVPRELTDIVLHNQQELTYYAPSLEEELSCKNYQERLKTLMYLEEIQMNVDIREFDLDRVCLRPIAEFLGLKVPGLAEGRPSILLGDKVMLTDPGEPSGPCYEGYVHEMLKDEVLLKFNPDFHRTYTGKDYDVVFTFNRGAIRKCHRAIEFAKELGENVLFPTTLRHRLPQIGIQGKVATPGQSGKGSQVKFFNSTLNDRQRSAVKRILQGQGRPLPYVIFGPPGTGKTVTVVEAILQIFTNLPYSRIIACTPSNSAADLLTERLHESGLLKTSHMVRLNALQRSEESLSESIRQYCSYGDNLNMASRFRILISTCVSAGALYGLGIKPGHFTHCFIDEAGQATEPESLISTCLTAGGNGQIILAGDPLQLGPILQSPLTSNWGLGMSLLERLMQRPLYQRNEAMFVDHGAYDPLMVTKLVENYRSHPSILRIPSQLFYHDELVVKADKSVIDSFCDWDMLMKTDVPCIFHGIRGEDTREGNSPSWFNPGEVVQVVRYLQAVLNSGRCSSSDIGIITPYRKQVEKVNLLIDKLDMDRVKVGSVEEFQGQERQVIIISTVRSNEDLIGFDVRHSLGFLSNPKRFNVSITRAQALLIVIGNPHVLYEDEQWRTLIEYCVEEGVYTGCDLP